MFRDPKNQKNAKTGSRLLAVFSSSGVAGVCWCCGCLPVLRAAAGMLHTCLTPLSSGESAPGALNRHLLPSRATLALLPHTFVFKKNEDKFVDFVFCVFGSLHTGGCRRCCGRRCCGFLKSLLSQEQTLGFLQEQTLGRGLGFLQEQTLGRGLGFLQEQTLGRGNARLVESRANARLLAEQP